MEEVTAYKCMCGEVYLNKNKITCCMNCGKEICPECASMDILQCWNCYEEEISEEG